MKTKKSFLCACLVLAAASLAAQGKSVAVSTNAAYFAISAFMIGPASSTILIPLEAQIALSDSIALNPAVGVIWVANRTSGAQSATFEAECGLAWRPEGKRLAGWYLCAGPGAAFSTDSKHFLVVANAEGGYQWILGKGLLLGAGAGGRVAFDLTGGGYIPLPDLKLRVGWAF
jgi:hypothetical protein